MLTILNLFKSQALKLENLINDGEFSDDFKESINFAYEDLKVGLVMKSHLQ